VKPPVDQYGVLRRLSQSSRVLRQLDPIEKKPSKGPVRNEGQRKTLHYPFA
jgi:hypothetical protein